MEYVFCNLILIKLTESNKLFFISASCKNRQTDIPKINKSSYTSQGLPTQICKFGEQFENVNFYYYFSNNEKEYNSLVT